MRPADPVDRSIFSFAIKYKMGFILQMPDIPSCHYSIIANPSEK